MVNIGSKIVKDRKGSYRVILHGMLVGLLMYVLYRSTFKDNCFGQTFKQVLITFGDVRTQKPNDLHEIKVRDPL